MRTALYFGSFDPIHIGHEQIANYFLNQSDISEVLIIPSLQSPHKIKKLQSLSFLDRIHCIKLVFDKYKNIKVLDVENNLPVPSYTINTLEILEKKKGWANLSIIIGLDNLRNLKDWKLIDKIFEKYSFLVYPRKNLKIKIHQELLRYKHKIIIYEDAPKINISSTKIWSYIKSSDKEKLDFWLDKKVKKYLESFI